MCFGFSQTNYSIHFDGANDSLLINHSNSLNFGTGDFAIEFWYKSAELEESSASIIRKKNGSRYFEIIPSSGNGGLPVFIFGNGSSVFHAYGNTRVDNNQWNHLTAVKSGNYTKPALRKRIFNRILAANIQGTAAGKWSARKAQMMAKAYKKAGGGYSGAKKSSNKLSKWSKQKWRTKSGKKSSKTGERYLPEKAIKNLSAKEYAKTTAKKRKTKQQENNLVNNLLK